MWRCGDGQAQRREDMYLRAVRHDGQAPRVVEGYTVSHKTFRKLLISPGAPVQNGYRTVDYALARSCGCFYQFKLLAEKYAATWKRERTGVQSLDPCRWRSCRSKKLSKAGKMSNCELTLEGGLLLKCIRYVIAALAATLW